jgi:excisionase family DNA binding protein
MSTTLPRFLTVQESAGQVGCSPWLIRKEIREGKLRAVRLGRVVRVLDEDLASFARGQTPGGAA